MVGIIANWTDSGGTGRGIMERLHLDEPKDGTG